MPTRQLREWGRGDGISARHLNEPVQALRQLYPLSGKWPIEVVSSPSGATIRLADIFGGLERHEGQIYCPTTDDYTDARYYVQPIRVSLGSELREDELLETEENPPPFYEGEYATPYPVTVVNLCELQKGTHLLRSGDKIEYWAMWDMENPRVRHYVAAVSPKLTLNVRISGNSQDGTNKRWSYSFVEVEKTTAAYAGWTDKEGGKTGTAYNRIEDQNAATGTYGNGVASTNLTGTFALKPVPTGTRVQIDAVTLTVAGVKSTEWWFSYENAVDGACP